MRYTLWHADSGNLIGDFESEDAALAAVRDEIRINDDADSLILQEEGVSSTLVAEGIALQQLAFDADRPALV